MGPKTFRAKTLDRLISEGICQKASPRERVDLNTRLTAAPTEPAPSTFTVPFPVMRPYLEICRHKMYSIWPILDVSSLFERLRESEVSFDAEANMLALSACTATILQLQLEVEGTGMPIPQTCMDKIEEMRAMTHYRRRPTLDSLLVSFFLHVCYTHVGHQSIGTLLLREAITMAHLLGLHQPSHYAEQDSETSQTHLRILWLLFITER
jgi:hypothetical protein